MSSFTVCLLSIPLWQCILSGKLVHSIRCLSASFPDRVQASSRYIVRERRVQGKDLLQNKSITIQSEFSILPDQSAISFSTVG